MTKSLIQELKSLTQHSLITLLNSSSTTPDLIHVSLNTGRDYKGGIVGQRLSYESKGISSMTDNEKAGFLKALDSAFTQITQKFI